MRTDQNIYSHYQIVDFTVIIAEKSIVIMYKVFKFMCTNCSATPPSVEEVKYESIIRLLRSDLD
jgi:hypothetical protein